MNSFGQPTVCPRCSKTVYLVEQVLGPARKVYHKYCFKCTSCNKRLDSNFVEHNEEPYCRQCHRNNFGTRDLRSANLGSPNRSTSNNELLAEDTSYRPMDHEEIETKSLQMATKTGSNMDNATSFGGISLVQTPLTSETLSAPLISRTDISISRQITGSGAARHPPVTPNYTGGMFSRSGLASRTPVSFGTSPNCPRCGKAVYFAEQVNAVGKKWHKACLTCAGCRKRLDSFSLQEHEDEPYCKACHIRQFGIRDLRSANLSPTTSA